MKNELTTLFASLIQERNNETPLKMLAVVSSFINDSSNSS